MKKIQLITLMIFAILAIQSCGDKVAKLKKERDELNKELASLNEKLEEVNGEIDKLEPMSMYIRKRVDGPVTQTNTTLFGRAPHMVRL